MIACTFPLPDLAATERLAQKLAPHVKPGDALALQGNLGAGKTAFARALLRVLGVSGDVPSPTFTLMQSYEVPGLIIHHFDLYRLEDVRELDELGWDEALADGLCLIEWPERAQSRLPLDTLTLAFSVDAQDRRSGALSGTDRWAACIEARGE